MTPSISKRMGAQFFYIKLYLPTFEDTMVSYDTEHCASNDVVQKKALRKLCCCAIFVASNLSPL